MNGPHETGLAAAGGDRNEVSSAIIIYANITDTMSRLPDVGNPCNEMLHLYRVAAFLVLIQEWYLYGNEIDGNVRMESTIPTLAAGAWEPDQAWFDAITESDVLKASLLCAASKVNMWMINHHVGVGGAVGFAAKALGLCLTEAATRDDVRAMWTLGHWNSTFGWWSAFGIEELRDPKNGVFNPACFPTVTRDIAIRVSAGPAGTAGILTYRAILNMAIRSIFSFNLPPSPDYAALMSVDPVCERARCHDGSLYFTGNPKEELALISEETKIALSAFVHAVAPGGSLAKAKVIHPIAAVRGTDVFVKIHGIVQAMRTAGSDARNLARMKLMAGISASGDPMAGAIAAAGLGARSIPTEEEITKAVDTATGAAQASGSAVPPPVV